MVTGWTTDPVHLDKIYRYINHFDWKEDFVRMFHQDYEPSLLMRTFLAEKKRKVMEVRPMNVYAISHKTSLEYSPT